MFTTPFKPYTLTGLKSCNGRDGVATSANVCRDGKKIGEMIDDGNGGGSWIRGISQGDRLALEGFVATLPSALISCDDNDNAGMRLEMFLAVLADATQNEARIRRLCKKKTLFRLVGDDEDEARTIDKPFSTDLAVAMRNKYGATLALIYNEAMAA